MKNVKYLIIGAGPAGLQMGYFLKKENLDYLIIERSTIAGKFFSKFPIHRKLISINKKHNFFDELEFNMRHDWNSLLSDGEQSLFTTYSDDLYPSADTYNQYLQDFAKKNQLNIQYNVNVEKISKLSNGSFKVKTNLEEDFSSEVLLIGTGALKQHMPKDIEGIEHTTSYFDFKHDDNQYINKRVAVIGGGNSGFETVNGLEHLAANVHLFVKNKPKLSHETHFVGNVRAKYTNIFDMFQLKALHAVLNPRIAKIVKLPNGNLQTEHEYDYPDSKTPGTLKLTREYEHIINCSGFVYTNLTLFDEAILPEVVMNSKFYALNELWESANIENLYFIGTNMQAIDRRSASGFVHGFRYNIRTLSNLLIEKFENKKYPSLTINLSDFNAFIQMLYTRFSVGDAIYQLYGFLGDRLIFNEKDNSVIWQRDLPVNYINKHLDKDKHTLVLTLDFGFHHYPNQSSLDFMKPSDPNDTEKAYFIHPVIKHYYQEKVEEFHFGDSLLGRWDMPHSDGGAVASYHTEFYNWMASIFKKEKLPLDNLVDNPNYVKWANNDIKTN